MKHSLFLASLLFATTLMAQNNASKADSILNRYEKVMGIDKLTKYKNAPFCFDMKITAFIQERTAIYNSTVIGSPITKLLYMNTDDDSGNSIMLLNVKEGWISSKDMTIKIEEKDIPIYQNTLYWINDQFLTKNYDRTFIETKVIDGITYDVVKLKNRKGGNESLTYFNKKTGLIAFSILKADEYTKKTYQCDEIKNEVYNYVEIADGAKIANTRNIINGKVTSTVEYGNIILNYPIENIDFSGDALSLKSDAYELYMKGLSNSDYKESIKCYTDAINIRPNYIEAHISRIGASYSLKDYQQTIKYCNTLLDIDSKSTEAYTYRAMCYSNLDENQKAISDYKTVLIYNPEDKRIKEILFFLQKQEKKEEERKQNNETVEEEKGNNFWNIMEAVFLGLNYANDIINGGDNNSTAMPVRSGSFSSGRRSGTKEPCSACNGTGKNLARERPAFYDSTTEDYERAVCPICGSSTNHYHKDCPSCGGKGYIMK